MAKTLMSTPRSIAHFDHYNNLLICRFCGEELINETTSGGSPGGSESDYATLDGNTWCNFAGNHLTFDEWRRQPQPTYEQWKNGECDFSPCQYHEPIRDKDSQEFKDAVARLIDLAA